MLALVFILSALFAFIVTGLSIRISLRGGVVDVPNARSSHSDPTPRLGGIGILISILLSFVVLAVVERLGFTDYPVLTFDLVVILSAGLTMGMAGAYDDLYHLRPLAKFLVQIALAGVVVMLGFRFESVSVAGRGPVDFGYFSIPVTLLWLTGFANIFNFMDGVDGLAGVSGSAYGGFLFLFAWRQGSPELATLAVVLAGSCLGFLSHNFPRARTFMGDTGSLMLGMILAILVVRLTQRSGSPDFLIAQLLLYSLYLWDSGFTLLRRLRRGENIFQAHRSHLYQRLAQLGQSHVRITGLYLLLHLLMGTAALTYASNSAARVWVLVLSALLLSAFTGGVYWLEYRVSRVG